MMPVLHIKDCQLIQREANNLGYDCTLQQAEELWEEYSESLSDSWLSVEDTDYDEKVCVIRDYFSRI